MAIQLTRIRGGYEFPRPNWDKIGRWIDYHVPEEERRQAWRDAVLQWLERINRVQGKTYQVLESEEIVALVPANLEAAPALLEYAGVALNEIHGLVRTGANPGPPGPFTILALADVDQFYRYLTAHGPEGPFGGPMGACIEKGYPHVVLGPGKMDLLQLWLTHELARLSVAGRDLPAWLKEGLTQIAEEAVHKMGEYQETTERVTTLKAYWHKQGLQDFWWGKGFARLDDRNQNSYDLARFLLKILVLDHRDTFGAFLQGARAGDAGASAARDHLDIELEELAARFLGAGDWVPVPPDAVTLCRRGQVWLEQEEYDAALEDFDEALKQHRDLVEAYTGWGNVHYLRGQYVQAIAEYEAALEREPAQVTANNNLAWLLATCPDAGVRDGERAMRHALAACEATGYGQWKCLRSLAAAHAACGEFREARTCIKDAYRRAPEDEKAALKDRWQTYKGETASPEEPALPMILI